MHQPLDSDDVAAIRRRFVGTGPLERLCYSHETLRAALEAALAEPTMALLDIPPILQAKEHDCGLAAAKCLLTYYECSTKRITTSPIDGLDPRSLETELRAGGLAILSGEASVEDLAAWCKLGRPVICLVHWFEETDSHYIVVRGVQRGRVYYHDVASGLDDLTIKEFEEQWQAVGRLGEHYHHWAITGWQAS